MHPVLTRQLKRLGLSEDAPPETVGAWLSLVARIDRAYTEADQGRYTLERSLSICSVEMQELYEGLRRKSESQIARSEHMLRCMLESIPHGVIVADEKGRFLYWNAAATEIAGTGPTECPPEDWSRVYGVYGSDGATLVPTEELPLVAAMRGEPVDAREHFLKTEKRPEGVWVVVHGRPLQDESGALRGGVIVVRDVTAEKAIQAALARAQSDFREVIELAPDAIAIIRDGNILYLNRAFADRVGLDPAAMVGTPFNALVAPLDSVRGGQIIAAPALSSPGEFQELRFVRSDGETFLLELSAAQTVQFEGRTAKLILARDVSERKRMHAQLLVSERMANLGTIAAGVAHEINNPLAAVISSLELSQRNIERLKSSSQGSRDLADLEEQLRQAHDAAQRVRHIVRDLKIFSRGDDSGMAVDLRRVVEASLRIAHNEIRDRARVVTQIGDIPLVLGNEARLVQVLLNLLVNAAHAIEEAEKRGPAKDHEIVISASRHGETQVVIEVRDTGQGMTPETLKQIFTPFFTTKPMGVGTGLGLSICHRIITELGGSIAAESEIGKGTILRLVLRAFAKPAANFAEKNR